LAVFLGFLMVWPFFYFQKSLGDEYKGILNQVIDDELFYMARIKDVIDSHQTLGNAYLFEHKSQLPQQLFLPEFLLAQPLKFLNLDIVQGRILYNFIFPALAFVLTYIVFYLVYPSKFWANLFAVFLIFGLYLFKFTRPVIPQFVFLFWLTQFIFLWLLIKDKYNDISLYHRIYKNWILLLNILNFGLLFYIYPFYWTFYLVFLVILSFLYFFREKTLFRKNLIILIGGLLIGSVYFYLTFLTSQLPEYQETLTRLQLVFSRSPSEIKSVALSLAVLLLMGVLYRLKRIKISKEILFFIAGILSILIVTNQNIITGHKFEFGHYRMLAIFFLAFTLYYLFTLKNKVQLNRIWQGIVLVVVGLFVFLGINGYASRTSRVSEGDIYRQKYAAVFDWFNKNTPVDSVIYANEDISGLIPVYTSNNVFYSRYANLFLMSDAEVQERFVLHNFFGEFNRDFIVEKERAIWGVRYVDRYGDAVQANKWRKLLGFELKDETRLPKGEVDKILAAADQIQNDSFERGLEKYRVDYFIWDKKKNSEWLLAGQNFLENIFEDNDFAVYKIK